MSEPPVSDLVEALILIRKRATYGLNSDAEGARNALRRVIKLCNEILSTGAEESES